MRYIDRFQAGQRQRECIVPTQLQWLQAPARKLRLLANVVLLIARATQGAAKAQEQGSRMLTALYRLLCHHTSRGTPQGLCRWRAGVLLISPVQTKRMWRKSSAYQAIFECLSSLSLPRSTDCFTC